MHGTKRRKYQFYITQRIQCTEGEILSNVQGFRWENKYFICSHPSIRHWKPASILRLPDPTRKGRILKPKKYDRIFGNFLRFREQSSEIRKMYFCARSNTSKVSRMSNLLYLNGGHSLLAIIRCVYIATFPHIFWSHLINLANVSEYRNIIKLIRIVLIIPSGTADVERSFSYMNHIESPSSSRLSLQPLEDRMRTTINAPDDMRLVPFDLLTDRVVKTL